jgi:hypothetical protein
LWISKVESRELPILPLHHGQVSFGVPLSLFRVSELHTDVAQVKPIL